MDSKSDKLNRALMAAIHKLVNQVDSLPPVQLYVVRLKHPEHGMIQINRQAVSAAAAGAAALKLAPGYELVEVRAERIA